MASIRVLLSDPSAHVEHWRAQLGLILQQASETIRALAVQAAEPGVGNATRTRLQALARSIADQADDIARVVGPALGGPLPPREGVGLPRGATDYVSCLFRDWAWSERARSRRTNDRSPRFVGSPHGRDLGRTLVLGAGACRLAYDLHVHCGGTETAVVDIDPYLLVVAEAVIRGATVSLTETSVNAPEVDPVSRRWTLSAPIRPARRGRVPLLPGEWHRAAVRGPDLRHRRDPMVHRPGPDRSRGPPAQVASPARAGRSVDQPRASHLPTGRASDRALVLPSGDLRSGRRRRVSNGRLGERVAAPSGVAADWARTHRERSDVRGLAGVTRAQVSI